MEVHLTIEASDIFGAALVVTILLTVLSVPSILLTVRSSSKQLKRYRLLRSADPEQIADIEIPKAIMAEWISVLSPVNFVSMIADELERLSSVKPAILQAEIALVLMAALAIIPGYEIIVLVFMIFIMLVIIASILLWYRNLRNYSNEYISAMSVMETKGNDSEDMIYR